MVRLAKVKIANFRLLADVELLLEEEATLVVGRNNSGKTSLSEVIRRFLSDSSPRFQIEDFSTACYERFCDALKAKNSGDHESEIRLHLPYIELRLFFDYNPTLPELGPLNEFIIDLDPNCTTALVVARYELGDGRINDFFNGQPSEELNHENRVVFFRSLRERIPSLYSLKIWAEDPNDPNNKKHMPSSSLRNLLSTGFVNAQRGLDDNTIRETDILAKILEGLFATATSPTSAEKEKQIALALEEAVRDIQQKLDADFNVKLKDLIPTLENFGYPGLGGPEITTETTLDVKRLLTNHTKVRYTSNNGILLPESYNGLGVRNLIFILLRIVCFYREYRAELSSSGVHLIFIEEPEAHLHPQMQEVFIRQLSKIAHKLNISGGDEFTWPVQFVVSTHSSHIANAAGFESIRYFLSTPVQNLTGARQTVIKDLRDGLKGKPEDHRRFMHQYLTLTRCDLFFADKAVLIEGTGERLMLPVMIEKMEINNPDKPKLSNQYLTIMEVGGAYAHLFFDLIDFLELRTLVITDFDSVTLPGGTACPVYQGTTTSNSCLKSWFSEEELSPMGLLKKQDNEKIKGLKRISYQVPEVENGPCGRTFEDAFILANKAKFNVQLGNSNKEEQKAWELVGKIKKSEFSLQFAIQDKDWSPPRYILEGLEWLSAGEPIIITNTMEILEESATTASGPNCD